MTIQEILKALNAECFSTEIRTLPESLPDDDLGLAEKLKDQDAFRWRVL